MNDQTEKTCPICAEAIKVAAKRCPYCLSDQRKGAFMIPLVPWLGMALWLMIAVGLAVIFLRVMNPGKDFTTVREQVAITSSELQFSSGEKGRYITTIGVITNGSDCGWKEVQMEARYFNKQGKLVDVGAQWFSELVVQPHSESAFRIRTIADQPDEAYASHQIVIRTAKDIKRWP